MDICSSRRYEVLNDGFINVARQQENESYSSEIELLVFRNVYEFNNSDKIK